MKPSSIVLEHPPKFNQIYQDIPLDEVISYQDSSEENRVSEYITQKGRYILGLYDFKSPSLFSLCKGSAISQRIVIRPLIFIDQKKHKHILTLSTYSHIPFKQYLKSIQNTNNSIIILSKDSIFPDYGPNNNSHDCNTSTCLQRRSTQIIIYRCENSTNQVPLNQKYGDILSKQNEYE
ncbi:Hypothetical_protein [Hexamita inflata]|uniref:Hypothetical_protein n=1 Tax=Hexamita inflata TaxID=28002 RepID=A0AA86PN95_9EUKA|nr:Hypothetical protein HINF_LOCUS25762 [Hexamita inflata]